MDNLKKFNAMEGNQSKELALQHARLMEKVEDLPSGTVVAPEVCAEIKRLQAELYKQLRRCMKGFVLSVIKKDELKRAITKKDLKFIEYQEIRLGQIGELLPPLISFHFDVFSSLNARVDRFKIEAPTKKEAVAKAQTRAGKYPGRVKIKIS